jgi:hypothetical protein
LGKSSLELERACAQGMFEPEKVWFIAATTVSMGGGMAPLVNRMEYYEIKRFLLPGRSHPL